MSKDLFKMSPEEKLNHLCAVIKSDQFRSSSSFESDVPFYICPFDPAKAEEMAKIQQRLEMCLGEVQIQFLKIDLYGLSIEMLRERNRLNDVFLFEQSHAKDKLRELLQGILDPETELVPAICKKLHSHHEVLLLSGIGEVFPYIRLHSLLNNLQSGVQKIPMVIFFPGEFTQSSTSGASLHLFGRLHDRYYRAFNIFHCEV